jgi:hypothetical protein
MKKLYAILLLALIAFPAQSALVASELVMGPGQRNGQVVVFAQPDAPAGPGRTVLDADMVSEGFFAAKPHGHGGIKLRACIPCIETTQYRGHGMIFGQVWGDGNFGMPIQPGYGSFAVLQTWGAGVVPLSFGYLMPQSVSPRLHDHVRYKVSVQSTVTIAGLRFMRYRIHALNFYRAQYELVMDTGDVLDNNWAIDMSRRNVIFFDASGPGGNYVIRFLNVHINHMPADSEYPDLTGLPWRRP